MISRRHQSVLWRTIKYTWRSSVALLIVCLGILIAVRWYQHPWSLEDVRSQLLLTLIGLTVSAWLIGILNAGVRRFPKTVVAGSIGLVLSSVFYMLLVWTQWKPLVFLWRAWWILLVLSIVSTHVVWLRLTARENWRQLLRTSITSAILAGAMFASLGLRQEILASASSGFWIVLGIFGGISLIGSILLWFKARKRYPGEPLAWWQKLAWATVTIAGVFAAGFYTGRVTMPITADLRAGASPLANVLPAELDAQIAGDLQRFRTISIGIDDLVVKSRDVYAKIKQARETDKRAYYLPKEEDELRAQFMSYLAYRAALLRMVASYADFQSAPREEQKAKCFLLGYAAGSTVMRVSSKLVAVYGPDEIVRRKLNEADPICGLSVGEYDRLFTAVTEDRNVELFESMALYFAEHRDGWRIARVLPDETFDFLARRIDDAITDVHALHLNRDRARFEQIVARVKGDAYEQVYDAQSLISTVIGDTRMVQRPPFISHEQILDMQRQLKPGDILLERRNWFMSNAFLPGFWPHAALYIGTIDDLSNLGLARKDANGKWTSDLPAIRDRLDAYLKPADIDHQPHTVLESVSEGVIFNSLTESMYADYVAILRPRLSDAQKAQAIAAAFSHQGKPYDFEFDFFSSDKLVCTELVYRSYEGLLHFELVRVMGRDTLPAVEICRKFLNERKTDKQQLDFVMFLDAVPNESRARLASETDLVQSIDRPRGFNE